MTLASVELSRAEIMTLLGLVRARAAEVDRLVDRLEEGEGEDLQRRNAMRTLRPQAEALSDLLLKLEGAYKETENP